MSVPRYPNETAPVNIGTDAPWVGALPDELANLMAEPVHPDVAQAALDDEVLVVESAIHPVDAFVAAAERWYPGKPISDELLVQARAWCDAPVCSTCGGSGEIDESLGGITTSGIVPCPDCSAPPADADASDLIAVERVIADLRQQIADLEAKLDAERTLRAQGAAELEREKAHERDRRIGAESRARDALWALDAAIEALTPLAGYATEEDGRVAGMTAPVCLAMSSVRRADAMVKLHRALRR